MKKVLIDGNSLLNAALLGGKDEEFGRTIEVDGKKTQVNGHQYGVDKFFDEIGKLCTEFEVAPRQMVLVWDGANSKDMRRGYHDQYKVGRDKAPEVSDELNKARALCTKMMLDLGAHVVQQTAMEADDVLAYLCKTLRTERNVVVTSDGDLTILHDENTDVWRLGKMNENPYGRFPHKYITLYKSLVGDTSDKIPGAKGFGDAAWCDLVRIFQFDGLDEVQSMILEGRLDELKDSVNDLKSLQKILDSKDLVTKSWQCAVLYPDKVNTLKRPLEIQVGMVRQWGASDDQVPELRRFYGTKTLVTADNYEVVLKRFAAAVVDSPFVSLDIETSSTAESDEWMERMNRSTNSDKDGIDVLGHELTGMGLTFGSNTQHTIYMSVDHKDTNNITVEQCRKMVELIPHRKMHTVIQNRSFEFSVLYRTWGEAWKDNGWHGFVPNAIDTMNGASYVNENLKSGLKQSSKHYLNYEQQTYAETTSKSGPVGSLKGGQVTKLFKQEMEHGETADWETRQYKMNELTGLEVLDYGADDTICTSALHTHYKLMMELENTWKVYLDVEQLPEYLTSLAFVQGLKISMQKVKDMERRDAKVYDEAWAGLREFLMRKGWEGTICPEFVDSIEPSDAKLAVSILLDGDFTTKKRKLNAIAADIREQFPDNADAELLATVVERDDIPGLNRLVKQNFTGEPKINFGSPKQMQHLFYNVLGMTPRIQNKMTDKQREDDPAMAAAFKKRRQEKDGKTVEYTADEREALISKSSTDDDAVGLALALDTLDEEAHKVLSGYQKIKEITTRRGLYYVPYQSLPHWRDGRIHPALHQSRAVTRRYSASAPNVQQMPSKGEGLELREVIPAHSADAVVASLDFSGQELRIGAELSGDVAMTSCYVGDNLRDMHSLTAVSAAVEVYKQDITYEQFQKNRKSSDPAVKAEADLMRSRAKTTNFSAQYGAFAESVAIKMKCEVELAQAFLDARAAAFPGIGLWDEEVKEAARKRGYSLTMLGARRHLREGLAAENSWERAKAERQVGNFWIQGSAGEMTKLAMARVWSSGILFRYRARFYFPVHDELVFSVHKDDAAEFLKEAHALMVANYAGMKIPLESSIAIGRTFACEHEVGTVPDAEAINKSLDEIFHNNTTKEMV